MNSSRSLSYNHKWKYCLKSNILSQEVDQAQKEIIIQDIKSSTHQMNNVLEHGDTAYEQGNYKAALKG